MQMTAALKSIDDMMMKMRNIIFIVFVLLYNVSLHMTLEVEFFLGNQLQILVQCSCEESSSQSKSFVKS